MENYSAVQMKAHSRSCNNVGESHKQNAEWRKSNTRVQFHVHKVEMSRTVYDDQGQDSGQL